MLSAITLIAIATDADRYSPLALLQKVGPKVKLLGELMPGDARVALFGELESYQRFVVLADELDDGLSRVPLPNRASHGNEPKSRLTQSQ